MRAIGWIIPLLIVVAFFFLIQRWIGFQPIQWTQGQLSTSWTWLTELGERLDPQITIETIPQEGASVALVDNSQGTLLGDDVEGMQQSSTDGALVNQSSVNRDDRTNSEGSAAETLNNGAVAVDEQSSDDDSTLLVQREPSPTVTQTAVISSPRPSATATARATATPSSTIPPPTPTVAATATATATNVEATRQPRVTSTRQPSTRQLRQGDDTLETIGAASLESEESTRDGGLILQPTATFTPGNEVAATATPTATPLPPTPVPPTPVPPTSTPTATAPALQTYTIQSGDTPLAIARRFGIGVTALLAANGLSNDDARRLRVGQTLVIPAAGEAIATPTALPTVQATIPPTALPVAPTSTTLATATPTAASAIRLDAPQLRSPEDGSSLSCTGENSLIWLPVPFMREDDSYLLHLGFLNGYNIDGSETIVWVLEQRQPASATIWRMDPALCGLSPQSFGRQWRWYVEVVEPAGDINRAVSLPSAIWGFSWN